MFCPLELIMKKIFVITLVLLLIFFMVGCTGVDNVTNTDNPTDNNVDENKTSNIYNNLDQMKKVQNVNNISINYTGRLEDGEVFDTSLAPGREALTFDVGAGQMIKGFDDGVLGMKVGEKKTITLAPKDAYGVLNEDNKQAIPFSNLPQQDFNVGQVVVLGQYRLKVYDVNDDGIVASVNHFLAGKTLIFDLELVSIN